MIRRCILLLLLLSSLTGATRLSAQVLRELDGQKYIAHTVLPGQTLFALSRHYAVPVEAITNSNPAARQGLSIGQVLLIPIRAQVKKELKTAPALMESELAHIVKKKETLFGIARQYGVEQSDLLTRNPELAAGLKDGMVVVIPVSKVTSVAPEQVKPAVDDKSTSHLVQPGETVFSLSKRFEMSVEDLQAANGGLPAGLKAGTYVRIPAKREPEKPAEPAPVVKPPSTIHKIALLLPFSLEVNDSVQSRSKDKAFYSVTDAAVQFYAGAQMALDSLEHMGLRADITVRDVGDDAGTWTTALKDPALKDIELAIGPFHRQAIESISRSERKAHVVCPVPQSNKVLLGNPNVSKVMSGRPDQMQHMARYVANHHARDNIILCAPDANGEKDLLENMQRTLNESLAKRPDRMRDSVIVVHGAKGVVNDVMTKLNANQLNVVVVPSESVEFVSSLISRLADRSRETRIVVFGLNSWTGMETIEYAKLEAVKATIPVSSYIDYGTPSVQRFVKAYRDRYENEPGDYAFLGFDVTFFYGTALMQFGASFPQHFDQVMTNPLHMSFKLMKTGEENGFRNENVVMLRFQPEGLRPIP
jgi:LysM repeat protein